MGKVKQAIQEVEETIVSLVEKKLDLSQINSLINSVKFLTNKDNPYFFNKEVVKKAFNKAVWERDNEEPYPTEDEIYKRYVYPLSDEELFKDAVNKKEKEYNEQE